MARTAEQGTRIAECRIRFADIFDGLADAITIVGIDCRIEFANRAAETIFGVPRDRLVGIPCDDPLLGLAPASGSQSETERFACCRELEPGETLPLIERTVVKPEREPITVLAGIAPLRDDAGAFLGAINTYTDITDRNRAEDSLRKSEERYRRFVETSHEGVLAQDERFNITFANGEIARMLGYRPEELVGRPVLDFVHPEDAPEFREQMERRAQGESSRYELRFVRSDGSVFWTRLSATPLRDSSGAFAGSFAMIDDINERKAAEETLWRSTQMLKLVLDNMPSFVFWKDRNSVYLGCNRLFAMNAGFESPEELIGLTDLDLPWKDTEAEGYRADDRMVMESGIPKIDYEETQLTADGRVTDVRTSKVPLRNPEGDVIGILGTFEDITEEKQAERRLRESEARLHGIVSNTKAAIHLSDAEGHLLVVNQRFAQMLGASELLAIGKTIRELSPSHELVETLEDRERQVRETGRSLQVEETLPTAEGPRTYVSLTFPLLDASGTVYAVGGISTDITQIKQAEDELRNKDLAIRRAYVDVIAAVTGNKLILMTPDEIEEALGEPVSDAHELTSYEQLADARHDVMSVLRDHLPGARNLDDFIVAVGEGLTNAIKHGGRGWYQLRRREQTLQVVITDEGPGVDFTTVPRATLEAGFSTRGTLGMGYTIMLESSERLLLSTQPGRTILVLECS